MLLSIALFIIVFGATSGIVWSITDKILGTKVEATNTGDIIHNAVRFVTGAVFVMLYTYYFGN